MDDVGRPGELTVEQCWRRLSQHCVGRVAYTERALPGIAVVAYALVGHQVVLRPRRAALARCLDGQIVAFEVGLGGLADNGWSVVLLGAVRVLGPEARPRRENPWVARPLERALALTPGTVRGFRSVTEPGAGTACLEGGDAPGSQVPPG